MSGELVKSYILSEEKLAAIKICPDFRLTNSGPYKRNIWTEFADNLVLIEPDQETGFNKNNYQNWLDWTFEMLSHDDHDNPLLEYAKDLDDIVNDRFKIPWLMSFKEKGFKFGESGRGWYGVRYKAYSHGNYDFERELVADRFGSPVLIERSYLNSKIDKVFMVFIQDGKTRLRFDYPASWGHQQLSRTDDVIGSGYKWQIRDLARVEGSVSDFIFRHRRLMVHNRRFLSVAQS